MSIYAYIYTYSYNISHYCSAKDHRLQVWYDILDDYMPTSA